MFFREDITAKLRRNCVMPVSSKSPQDAADTPLMLLRTLADQGHLCSLPQHMRPVYWEFDHALSLYPLPTQIFLGDKVEAFTKETPEVTLNSVSSFPASDFSFLVYWPGRREVEVSSLQQS